MAPWELIGLALWSFAVALAGGVAGLVLGNLRLPLVLQFSASTSTSRRSWPDGGPDRLS